MFSLDFSSNIFGSFLIGSSLITLFSLREGSIFLISSIFLADVFSLFCEIDPNNALSYELRADAKSKLRDYQGAINDYSKAIEIKPNNCGAYNNLGNTLKNKRDFKRRK